nr:family 1 glycosylhydrolase [Beutenbergia cavernae]
MVRRFPADFLWGSATAAFQIEGAAWEDGRADSIWDAFARVPGAVVGGDDGSVATDHYHRYAADVELMAELGLGAYRFSTSWARICPDGGAPNRAGLDFYSRLVDALLEAGITPWLTLYHWDLPQTLEEQGGWTNRDVAQLFVDYALATHEALGDRVRHWTTLNEPWCSAFLGYAGGQHAPGRRDDSAALAALHHLLLAHGLGITALRERDADASLGITLNHSHFWPADPDSAADLDAVRRMDALQNRLFLDPIFRGSYPADALVDLADVWPDVVRDGDLATIAAPIDVLGVNYYTASVVTADGVRGGVSLGDVPSDVEDGGSGDAAAHTVRSPWVGARDVRVVDTAAARTAMDWEVHPDALRDLLVRIDTEYARPAGTALVVTENGAAYDDEPDSDGLVDDVERRDYVAAHLAAVHEAIQTGADVRGYFLWSLLDNFEWAFGYSKRFGIVRVDYDTLRRTPKGSALWYSSVARSGELGVDGAR